MTTLIKAEYSPSSNISLHTYSDGQIVGFANVMTDPQDRADRHASLGEEEVANLVSGLIPCDEETFAKVRGEASDWKVIYQA